MPGRRWKISYRISLLVAIPALEVALSGLIIWQTYSSTLRETEELAHSLFRDLSRQAFHRARERLLAASSTVALLSELSEQGRLGGDRRSLAEELLAILRAHADYTWVSLSGEDGSFTGAYRDPDGSFRLNMSWIVNGKTRLEELAVLPDGSSRPSKTSDDYGYDPRERPFYKRIANVKQGAWMPPYVFFEGIPGITYAAPQWDRQKKMIGVFSVDFDLNRLSELMKQVRGPGVGTIFMFTPEGTLLAHPELKIVEKEGPREARLLTLSDVRDPVLRAYQAAARGVDMAPAPPGVAEQNVRRLAFTADGVEYLAAGTAYRVSDDFSVVVGLAAPASAFLGRVRENMRTALLLALVVLAVGVGVAILFANMVASPILEVAAEMDRVGRFDLREVPPDRSIFKEINRMERSLDAMIRSLASFAAYVPRDLVQQLVTTGRAARLEGQTKRLTILFTDVAGFTSIAEQLPPNDVVQRLGAYFSEVTGAIAAGGGTIDKFLGDGVLAFWNAPVDQPDHARLAVRAALGLRHRLDDLRRRGEERALPTRMGLATGDVVVGNIGTPERMNYTVSGDTVNVASRLEGLNKEYGTSILMVEETAQAVQGDVIARPVDLVAVVGRREGVKVWEPLSPREGPDAEALSRLADQTARALEDYIAGKIELALQQYRAIQIGRPDDPVASAMSARCEELLKSGLPVGWSGMTRIRHK